MLIMINLVAVMIPLLDVSHQEFVIVKSFVQSSVQTVWYLLAKHDQVTNANHWEYHTCVQFFVKQIILYHYCFMVFWILAIFLLVVMAIPLLHINHQGIVVVKLLV